MDGKDFAAAVERLEQSARACAVAIEHGCHPSSYMDDIAATRCALLARHETAIRAAILAERESCAKILDENAKLCRDMNFITLAEAASGVAKAIRGRAAP